MCLSSSVVCEWEKKKKIQKVPKKDQLGQTGPRGCFEKKKSKDLERTTQSNTNTSPATEWKNCIHPFVYF